MNHYLQRYVPCGKDNDGRSVCWVRPDEPVDLLNEADFIRAVIVYFMALHADIQTMRYGITVVIDTSRVWNRMGNNEKKLQRIINTIPSR